MLFMVTLACTACVCVWHSMDWLARLPIGLSKSVRTVCTRSCIHAKSDFVYGITPSLSVPPFKEKGGRPGMESDGSAYCSFVPFATTKTRYIDFLGYVQLGLKMNLIRFLVVYTSFCCRRFCPFYWRCQAEIEEWNTLKKGSFKTAYILLELCIKIPLL